MKKTLPLFLSIPSWFLWFFVFFSFSPCSFKPAAIFHTHSTARRQDSRSRRHPQQHAPTQAAGSNLSRRRQQARREQRACDLQPQQPTSPEMQQQQPRRESAISSCNRFLSLSLSVCYSASGFCWLDCWLLLLCYGIIVL